MATLRATSQVRKLNRFFGIALGVLLVLTAVPGYGPEPLRNTASAAESPTRLPLSFVPNAGQTNPIVRFMAHSPAGRFFFTPTTVVLALTAPRLPDPPDPANPFAIPERPDPPSALRMRFLGVRVGTTLTGARQLPGTANYLMGSDPARWRSRLPTYAAIVYEQLYNGIDLRYEGGESRLKSTYLVAAGADPGQIRWRYEGATRVQIDSATGDLVITVPIAPQSGGGQHTLRERAPVAWQMVGGQQVAVTASYVLAQDGSIGFALGAFDAGQPLVIDPTLAYSTYLGGSFIDWGQAIAMDSSGHVFVTGWTYSTDFPTEVPWQPNPGGSYDVYVSKFSVDGSALEFSTYLGGAAYDGGYGIAVDRAGNAVVVGKTLSLDFPLAYAPFQPQLAGSGDAFVIRLSGDGASLLHGTYLGGSSHDQGFSIAVDQGNAESIYITGSTRSSDFPTADPWQGSLGGSDDAFVAKLSSQLDVLAYSTYLGGNSLDWGYGIAVDGGGNAYVVGTTYSNNGFLPDPLLPFLGGPTDGFVAKLSNAGSPVYSTYLGGSAHESAWGIAVDSAGAAYIVGETRSTNFPVVGPLQATNAGMIDVFVTKLNPAGSGMSFSTYLGGSSGDNGFGIALDFTGSIYVTGRTYSYDFPIVDALQSTVIGDDDVFVAKMKPDGSALTYSTYLGGSGRDLAYQVAVDNACNAAITGFTLSQDYPISPNAVQPKPGGSYDAFVSKIGGDVDIWVDTTAISVTLQPGESITVPITIGNDGDETLCYSITKEEVSYPAQDATIEFPPYKVDPALEDALEEAPDGMADFLVYLTTQADLSTAYEIEDWSERGWYVYDTLRDTAANTQDGVLAELADLLEVGHVTAYEPHFVVNAVSATGGDDAVDTLALRTDVAHIALNAEPEPTSVNQEGMAAEILSFVGVPWGVEHIGADQVWSEYGYTGKGIVVANMDTGVDYTHPGLLHQYRGYDPDTGQLNHDYNWYDPNLSSPCPNYPCDYGNSAGHGTGTMGVIVGHEDDGRIYGNVDYNGQFINYTGAITTGVAPGAAWIATKGGGLNVADWLIAPCPIGVHPNPTSPDPRCDPDKRPHIVNYSFEGGASVTNRLRAAGILPVLSAGNDGYYPDNSGTAGDEGFCTLTTGAAEPSSFASGGVRRINDQMCVGPPACTWSSRGPGWIEIDSSGIVTNGPEVETNEIKPDVVAPGGWILSTALFESTVDCATPGAADCDGYGNWAGTSFAAPHVAGATAVLLNALWSSDQADPTTYGETDISKLECLLTSTAVDMVDVGGNPRGGWPGPDYASGYGRIDVYEAARTLAAHNFPLWLKLAGTAPSSPASMSGTVPPGYTTVVEIEISAVCPTTGSYQAQLVINSNDPHGNPIVLSVDLTVQDEPLPTCPYEPPTD